MAREEGQLQKCPPMAPIVTVECSAHTLSCEEGHVKNVGSVPKITQGRTAASSISYFPNATRGVDVGAGDMMGVGGNPSKYEKPKHNIKVRWIRFSH